MNWGGRVVDLALLVAVGGVNEEGYREVLAVEGGGWGEEGGVAQPAEGACGAGVSRGESGHLG